MFTWLVLILIVSFVYAVYQNEANMTPEQKIARDKKWAADKLEKEKAKKIEQAQRKKKSEASDLKSKQDVWIVMGQDAVKERLKDPSSARFKDVFFHRGADNVPMTCGQVNSKNSFGGYTGYKRFVSAGKPELTFIDGDSVEDFSEIWNRLCTGK